jgi:hypothetical protein
MVYNALTTYVHTIIATSDYNRKKNKSDPEVCAYFNCLFVISSLVQGKTRQPEFTSKKQITYTGKKNSFEKIIKHKTSPRNKVKFIQCHLCNIKGHEEDMCHFKVKSMLEAQCKTKQNSQQKPKETSSEAFTVE